MSEDDGYTVRIRVSYVIRPQRAIVMKTDDGPIYFLAPGAIELQPPGLTPEVEPEKPARRRTRGGKKR